VNSDKDFEYFEIKSTVTNSDGADDFVWFAVGGTQGIYQTREPFFDYYRQDVQNGHVRIRAVNRSGTASAWHYAGNIASYTAVIGGDMSLQNKTAVNITGGTAALTSVTISDGSATLATARAASLIVAPAAATSPRAQLALYAGSDVKNMTAGTPTDTLDVDITNRGFTAKPDWGLIQIYDTNYLGVYDFDTGSTSTNARFVLFSVDGGNLSTGNRRYHFILGKY
jgi:hypothetical protein